MYTLFSDKTPNGFKPIILLEELACDYELKRINIREGAQFTEAFTKISPNNKIPAFHDRTHDLYLFESLAIMQYLAEKHQQFLPTALQEKSKVLQWCYFQVGHIGPMFGQYGHFHRYAPEDISYAKKRYADECQRLLSVMDKQLASNEFISGADYSIADMAIWPWIYCYIVYYQAELNPSKFPNVASWYQGIEKRKAVLAAIAAYAD